MKLRIIMKERNSILSTKESIQHRHLDCPKYERCLDKAINKNWESFSCAKCPYFKNYVVEDKKKKEKERKENRIFEEVSFNNEIFGGCLDEHW